MERMLLNMRPTLIKEHGVFVCMHIEYLVLQGYRVILKFSDHSMCLKQITSLKDCTLISLEDLINPDKIRDINNISTGGCSRAQPWCSVATNWSNGWENEWAMRLLHCEVLIFVKNMACSNSSISTYRHKCYKWDEKHFEDMSNANMKYSCSHFSQPSVVLITSDKEVVFSLTNK